MSARWPSSAAAGTRPLVVLRLSLVLGYWNPAESSAADRAYHHTAPINMVYALREALRIVVGEEWLATTWERHRRAHHALRDALAVLGCERLAPDGEQLHPLLAVTVPDGLDEAAIRSGCCTTTASRSPVGWVRGGKVCRIGVMASARSASLRRGWSGALAELLKADPPSRSRARRGLAG